MALIKVLKGQVLPQYGFTADNEIQYIDPPDTYSYWYVAVPQAGRPYDEINDAPNLNLLHAVALNLGLPPGGSSFISIQYRQRDYHLQRYTTTEFRLNCHN